MGAMALSVGAETGRVENQGFQRGITDGSGAIFAELLACLVVYLTDETRK